MTLEEVSKLTDEELRIKVAELCGWEIQWKSPAGRIVKTIFGWHDEWHDHDLHGSPTEIPDYPQDLNAMHEAEKVLEGDYYTQGRNETTRYVKQLGVVCMGNISNSTARQRAEAFVLTMEEK